MPGRLQHGEPVRSAEGPDRGRHHGGLLQIAQHLSRLRDVQALFAPVRPRNAQCGGAKSDSYDPNPRSPAMPVYRVTDTRSGEQTAFNQPTDWDAWMAYRFEHLNDPFPRLRFRATSTPGPHHYAIEQIDPVTGDVVSGTYLTMFQSVADDPTARE